MNRHKDNPSNLLMTSPPATRYAPHTATYIFNYQIAQGNLTSSVAAGFGQHAMPPPVCIPDVWPFDLETGVRVTSKVGNLHSKFGLELFAMFATDGQTDGRTKATLIAPFPTVGNNGTPIH